MRRLFFVVFVLLTACVGHSSYMTEATLTSARVEPDTQSAVVTFIRPSRFAVTLVPTILDENASFLGACDATSKFSVSLAPGHHVFVVWAENSDALAADLAPGKHYYVEVSGTEGWTSARFHLIALTPRSKKWHELDRWLGETTTLVPLAAGRTYVDSRRDAAMERVRRGMEHLRSYDTVDLEKRTIRADDGN